MRPPPTRTPPTLNMRFMAANASRVFTVTVGSKPDGIGGGSAGAAGTLPPLPPRDPHVTTAALEPAPPSGRVPCGAGGCGRAADQTAASERSSARAAVRQAVCHHCPGPPKPPPTHWPLTPNMLFTAAHAS